MIKTFLNICFCLFCLFMSAQQNLVPNGSFEIFDTCPNNAGQVNFARYWFDPTFSSSDYFNSCCLNGIAGVPSNIAGYKYPQDGNGMMGLAGYQGLLMNNYREYIAVKLISTLDSNEKYCFSCYVSIDASFHYACNGFGGLVITDTSGIYSYQYNTIQYPTSFLNNNIISDTSKWVRLEFDFVNLNKNAQFLILGFFLKDVYTTFFINNQNFINEGAYYFIDNVTLAKCDDDNNIIIPNVLTINNDGINEVFKINGLLKNTKISIFNRWGNQIYSSENYQNDWTPSDVNAGTFYYLIQTETKIYKGFLEIFK